MACERHARPRLEPDPTLQEALAHQAAGRHGAAQAALRRRLRAQPRDFDALHLLGLSLLQGGAAREAAAMFTAALAIRPEAVAAGINLAAALSALGRPEAALAACEAVLAREPGAIDALYNRGVLLQTLRRPEAAVASYDRLLALRADHVQAWRNRAVALAACGAAEAALASYAQALALGPDDADTLINRGNLLFGQRRFAEAAADFGRVAELAPDHPYGVGMRQWAEMRLCDWRRREDDLVRVRAQLAAGRGAMLPYALVALSDREAELLACARQYAPPAAPAVWRGERYGHDRIRLGYLCGDFHEHATTHLMAELFERHDRGRFETFALSFGPASDGAMRRRLLGAFAHFIDLAALSDGAAAALIRAREIDILVDLTGLHSGARTGILAARPAPVQVNYLVFPGTMGAEYVDYLIADPTVLPAASFPHYAERVAWLPECYQPTDTTRPVGPVPARADLGLPGEGVVFCCFNNAFKIGPETFALWMRLLQAVPGSVLWLLADEAAAVANLRRSAVAAGVDAARLVFAPRVALPEHLARHGAADLFLDTLPYNAHTTASDALWAGLPVLTRRGTSFAGRVAASVVMAAGLGDMVCDSAEEYLARAVQLGRDPAGLAALRARLADNRATCALFDTDRLRRHLEAAYVTMWRRAEAGEAPEAFAVPAD